MWATLHSSQADEASDLDAAELRDGALAADGGERAEVAIAERRRAVLLSSARPQEPGDVLALLLGDGATPGQRLALRRQRRARRRR